MAPRIYQSCAEGVRAGVRALPFVDTAVSRPDLVARQFDGVGSDTHREVEAVFAARTRAEWEAFNAEHDCCLEPVLGLDEALESELVRAREMVVEVEQPGAGPVRLLGAPVKLSRTPADPRRAGGPVLGADTEAVLAEAGYSVDEIHALMEAGAVAGPSASAGGAFLS